MLGKLASVWHFERSMTLPNSDIYTDRRDDQHKHRHPLTCPDKSAGNAQLTPKERPMEALRTFSTATNANAPIPSTNRAEAATAITNNAGGKVSRRKPNAAPVTPREQLRSTSMLQAPVNKPRPIVDVGEQTVESESTYRVPDNRSKSAQGVFNIPREARPRHAPGICHK